MRRMWKGALYSEVNNRCSRYADLSRILDENGEFFQWKPKEKILDAGCGPGDVTSNVLMPWLPKDFDLVLGVDISSELIKYALDNFSSSKVIFDTLEIGSNTSGMLHNESYLGEFDKIFSFYVLHWLQNLEKGLKHLHSLLKPGGQALFFFSVDDSFKIVQKEVTSYATWSKHFQGVNRIKTGFQGGKYPSREFQEMLITAGFEVIKCEENLSKMSFDSIDVFRDFTQALDPHIGHVPAHMTPRYLNDCIRRLEDMKAIIKQGQKVTFVHETILAIVNKPQF